MTQQTADDAYRFAQWTAEHWGVVRGFVLSLVQRPDVADDVTQETFRRALESVEKYTESGQARSYLLKIADRLVVDHARQKQREVTLKETKWQRLQDEHESHQPDQLASQKESQQQLNKALNLLSEEQRRVLLLRYYGEMKFSEIAEITQWPVNTVLSNCRRGLLAMRDTLHDSG